MRKKLFRLSFLLLLPLFLFVCLFNKSSISEVKAVETGSYDFTTMADTDQPYYKWVSSTKTLTLKGAFIFDASVTTGFILPASSTIVVEEASSVHMKGSTKGLSNAIEDHIIDDDKTASCALYCNGDLTITGDYGVVFQSGDVLYDETNVTNTYLPTNTIVTMGSVAMIVNGTLTVSNKSLEANSGAACRVTKTDGVETTMMASCGILAKNFVSTSIITTNSTMACDAFGDPSYNGSFSAGIYCYGDTFSQISGSITSTVGYDTYRVDNNRDPRCDDFGIYAKISGDTILFKDTTLTIKTYCTGSGGDKRKNAGIYASSTALNGKVKFDKSKVTIDAGLGTDVTSSVDGSKNIATYANGIETADGTDIEIFYSYLYITTETEFADSFGLYSSGTIYGAGAYVSSKAGLGNDTATSGYIRDTNGSHNAKYLICAMYAEGGVPLFGLIKSYVFGCDKSTNSLGSLENIDPYTGSTSGFYVTNIYDNEDYEYYVDQPAKALCKLTSDGKTYTTILANSTPLSEALIQFTVLEFDLNGEEDQTYSYNPSATGDDGVERGFTWDSKTRVLTIKNMNLSFNQLEPMFNVDGDVTVVTVGTVALKNIAGEHIINATGTVTVYTSGIFTLTVPMRALDSKGVVIDNYGAVPILASNVVYNNNLAFMGLADSGFAIESGTVLRSTDYDTATHTFPFPSTISTTSVSTDSVISLNFVSIKYSITINNTEKTLTFGNPNTSNKVVALTEVKATLAGYENAKFYGMYSYIMTEDDIYFDYDMDGKVSDLEKEYFSFKYFFGDDGITFDLSEGTVYLTGNYAKGTIVTKGEYLKMFTLKSGTIGNFVIGSPVYKITDSSSAHPMAKLVVDGGTINNLSISNGFNYEYYLYIIMNGGKITSFKSDLSDTTSVTNNVKMTMELNGGEITTMDMSKNMSSYAMIYLVDNGGTITNKVGLDAYIQTVGVSSVSVSGEKDLELNETVQLSVEVLPANASSKKVEWKSSDSAIASVDQNGLVTAHKAGTVTITATSTLTTSKSATVTIKVNGEQVPDVDVTKVEVAGDASMEKGQTQTLTVTITPTNATDKSVTWKSSDDTIATVDATGLVTAVKAGKVTITATSVSNETISAKLDIEIVNEKIAVTRIEVVGEAEMLHGESQTLTINIIPLDATDKTVSWASSDETILSVSADGKVTGLKVGSATITATSTSNPSITKTFDIKVNENDNYVDVTGVDISGPSDMTVGDTETIAVTVTPTNATNKNVTFASSDDTVVSVDENGKLTALKAGTATITVKSVEKPEILKTLEIIVKAKPSDPVQVTDSGVEVDAPSGVLPTDAVLNVEVLDVKDYKDVNLEEAFGKNSKIAAVFSISVSSGNAEIQPNGSIKVTIEIPSNLLKEKDLKVAYIKEDGTVTLYDSVVTDGKISFTTDHLSTWALVKTSTILSAGAIAGIIIAVILGLALIAFITFYLLWKFKGIVILSFLTMLFRKINKLLFKNELNDKELLSKE